MTQKQIYDAVCDLADDESVSPEEYILALIKKRNDSVLEGTDGLRRRSEPDSRAPKTHEERRARSKGATGTSRR